MKLLKRFWRWNVNFWKGIWIIIKSMGSWKGITSLILVWLILSGIGVIIVGTIIRNGWLVGIGTTIFAFWAGPFTPLIPITIALAMVIQRYIFRDKNVKLSSIKEKFKEAFKKDDENDSNSGPDKGGEETS